MNNIIKIVISFFLISSVALGQVEKKIGDFSKVTSFDRIDVLLIPSNENKVVLQGKEANEVELVNKNGELKIRMPLTKLLDGDDISVTVYYKKIEEIEANEGSRITSNISLKTTIFTILAKEGSEVKLSLEVSKLIARVANGSNLTLIGNSQNQEVVVNSGGIYHAEKFITFQTIITCNAGGEAEIFASEIVDAKVRAGGDILIYGKPKQINQKVIAGGSINEAK